LNDITTLLPIAHSFRDI